MHRKILGIVSAVFLGLALAAVAPPARADELNQMTQFTFNRAVALPGKTVLPAGTYWFMTPDFNVPGLVQVFNADRSHVVAQFLTIPKDRMTMTDHSQLTFAEQSGKRPIALMDWFYPDRLTGQEFVFSSRMESRLREDPHVTVLAKPAPQLYG